MRDSASMMTENIPPPQSAFKLEREPTLMPNEFRERMSARHRSRKSSATRSDVTNNGTISRQPTGTLRYHKEISSPNTANYQPVFCDEPTSPTNELTFRKTDHKKYEQSVMEDENLNEDRSTSDSSDNELLSTSRHIQLQSNVKFMLDNAYANYESHARVSLKTPPQNMQLKDLMIPLDDWNSKETRIIREKKYAVLPSIHSTSSSDGTDINSARNSMSSTLSINNQLDFFRDKIEQEADFFADFRVNTSNIKATPRQDPLPPIKHGTVDDVLQNSARSKTSGHSSRTKHRNKQLLF